MPAKIRKIKGTIKLQKIVEQIDPFSNEPTVSDSSKSVAFVQFNKSLDYRGGTLGKVTIERIGRGDDFVIKAKQDLNNDGKFGKDELIYKGKIKDVEEPDALINFEGKIKIKMRMNACLWDLHKRSGDDGDFPVSCSTLDRPLEYTEMMLKPAERSGLKPILPVYFQNHEAIVDVAINDIAFIEGI